MSLEYATNRELWDICSMGFSDANNARWLSNVVSSIVSSKSTFDM